MILHADSTKMSHLVKVTVYILQGSCKCRQLLWSQMTCNPYVSKDIKKIS